VDEGLLPGSEARCDADVLGGASNPWVARKLTYVAGCMVLTHHSTFVIALLYEWANINYLTYFNLSGILPWVCCCFVDGATQ